jgi:hypothetical protein
VLLKRLTEPGEAGIVEEPSEVLLALFHPIDKAPIRRDPDVAAERIEACEQVRGPAGEEQVKEHYREQKEIWVSGLRLKKLVTFATLYRSQHCQERLPGKLAEKFKGDLFQKAKKVRSADAEQG